MNTRTITRSWRRSTAYGEQVAHIHLIVVHSGPAPEIVFTAPRQHRFGNPRHYEWSGWHQDESAFHHGRALPFDLVVGPPQPPFRSRAFQRNNALSEAIEASNMALERARMEAAEGDVNTVDLFHPIIVMAGSMRAATVPVKWCRLERHFIATHAPHWIDVVAEPAFAETVSSIFAAYDCLLRRLRCLPAVA